MESPSKKRRISLREGNPNAAQATAPNLSHRSANAHNEDEDANILIPATSEVAGRTVAPFLAKHIPNQYAPLGKVNPTARLADVNPNTKYCYRHRPDRMCRRQADEPSMDQLQH
ncbi:MAG: hypothetical protein Q9190_007883, partial [Brigantiaea leucoxantha]